jgi:hypothetical protein
VKASDLERTVYLDEYNKHLVSNPLGNPKYLKQYTYDNIKNFSIKKRFNILFGLLTKEERTCGLNYVNNFQ